MGWLWDIVWGFLPDFWPWLAGAIGAVGLYVLGRLNGGAKARQKQADAALDATVKGNEAARQGRLDARDALQAGKTPQEIKEASDAKWR